MILTNMNTETGIHFGVIPKNDLWNCAEEFFDYAEDVSYNDLLQEIMDAVNSLNDIVDEKTIQEMIELAQNDMNENYNNDCAQLHYEQNGYILEANNDDCDLFIIKSPYWTWAPQCSQCTPGAGYLPDADEDASLRTYCLGPEWFENEQAPYKCHNVDPSDTIDEATMKWLLISHNEETDKGRLNCPLCEEHTDDDYEDRCGNCPIHEKTRNGCTNKEYISWCNHMRSEHDQHLNIQLYCYPVNGCTGCTLLSLQEALFINSLR
jgi:hypothetical protein